MKKQMTQRDTAIALMRIAGYHNDQRERVRLICESRVNRQVMEQAWIAGFAAKQSGITCGCYSCKAVNRG